MDKYKLRAKMSEHGDTSEVLAEVLGMHRSCLSAKMNGYRGAEFNQTEIKLMAKRYEMTDTEVCEIFFNE